MSWSCCGSSDIAHRIALDREHIERAPLPKLVTAEGKAAAPARARSAARLRHAGRASETHIEVGCEGGPPAAAIPER